MSCGPRRGGVLSRPAWEPLEGRLLLDGVWAGEAPPPPDGLETLGYDPAWIAQPPEPALPCAVGPAAGPPAPAAATGVFDIYVEQGLLASIQTALNTYVADLTAEGYTVAVQEWSGTAEAMRAQLQARYAAAGLEGALFVGDLPTMTFTHANDFNGATVTFIHDLYFMDLDGTYVMSDTGPDSHLAGSGDILPEIYISRITTSTVTGLTGLSEAELINRYFAKVHAYRTGALTYANRGILWSDDDWRYTSYFMGGTDLYAEVLNVRDPAETTRQSYLDCLALDYESMMGMIHSSTTYHSVSGTGGGSISSTQIYQLNPRQAFYNLWNCSSGNFTVANNLICTYVYSGDYGLNAVGTTKTGSMLASYYFYRYQGEGDSLGQAFTRWWESAGIGTDSLKSWHYGMVMQGDPTLRPAAMGDARLVADAGDDQQVNLGRTVTLDGSATRNPGGGEPAWLWEQLSGPQVALLGADQPQAAFTPAEAATYRFRLTVQVGELVSTDEVNVVVVVAAPTGVDLLPESDTGRRSDDDLTRLNNAEGGSALHFLVSGTTAGATVALYADGVRVGSALAAGDTTLVATDGALRLEDGPRAITARQAEPGQGESPDSPELTVVIDTRSPGIASARTSDAMHVVVRFDEPVAGESAGAAGSYQLDHGLAVVAAAVGGDPAAVVLTLGSAMVEGVEYTLTVQGVEDPAGNAVAAGSQAAFFLIDPALLLWWTFDDGAGATAADASAHGRDGEVRGATWDAAGRIGGALRFDGGDGSYVVDEDAEDYLNGLGAITVAMWIRADERPDDRGFLTTDAPPNKECLSIRYNERGDHSSTEQSLKAYVQTTIDKNLCEGPDGTYSLDWQHVTMTWAADSAIRLYIDGVPVELSYDEGNLGGATAGATTLIVGKAYKTANGAWKGLIDDVRIYARCLSGPEIAALANLDPAAANDSYGVDQDQPLAVAAADGVLRNDGDGDAAPQALTAALLDGPRHGRLDLQPDGSFLYVPEGGFAGTDTFTYRAFDGLEYSNAATVTVKVRDTRPPVLTAAWVRPVCGTIDLAFSEPVTIALADVALTDADGRDVDLGNTTLQQGGDGTTAALTFAARPPGGYYTLTVKDGVRDLAVNPLDGDADGQAGGDYREVILVPLPGDATRDGRVDLTDYVTFKSCYGMSGGAGWEDCDFDGDGRVGRTDLLLLRANFGKCLAPPPAPATGPDGQGGASEGPPPAAADEPAQPAGEEPPAPTEPAPPGTQAVPMDALGPGEQTIRPARTAVRRARIEDTPRSVASWQLPASPVPCLTADVLSSLHLPGGPPPAPPYGPGSAAPAGEAAPPRSSGQAAPASALDASPFDPLSPARARALGVWPTAACITARGRQPRRSAW